VNSQQCISIQQASQIHTHLQQSTKVNPQLPSIRLHSTFFLPLEKPPGSRHMRLLSIEDERSTAAYLQKGLTEHGHVVDTAFDGVEGLHLATSGHYDLILLDVGLPGASGWDVLQGIRTQQQTPVFFISGRDEVEDRVKGLLLGADDYMVKPFAFSELLARIQVVARRRAPMSAPEGVLRVGELEVDTARRRVKRGALRIDLTTQEFVLLDYLARHAGQVVSRTLIAQNVWDMHFDSDTNVVDVAVRRLRAKIDEPFAEKLIHTVRGVGYVLEPRHNA
jgi:two-component system, OmpR family, copper resistance phosphate regulon response regulator CusR